MHVRTCSGKAFDMLSTGVQSGDDGVKMGAWRSENWICKIRFEPIGRLVEQWSNNQMNKNGRR